MEYRESWKGIATEHTLAEVLGALSGESVGGINAKPSTISAELVRPADTTSYAVEDSINSSVGTPVPLLLNAAALTAGGGCSAFEVVAESDILALANGTIRVSFWNDTPTIVGDNLPQPTLYANKGKRQSWVDITFEPLNAASGTTSVIGKAYVNMVLRPVGTVVPATLTCKSAFTPTSGGKITITINPLILA